jgi:D-ribose pyranase
VLAAMRNNYTIGAATMAVEAGRENGAHVLAEYQALVGPATIEYIPHLELKNRVPSAFALIRTGDTTQFGNILLQSG